LIIASDIETAKPLKSKGDKHGSMIATAGAEEKEDRDEDEIL